MNTNSPPTGGGETPGFAEAGAGWRARGARGRGVAGAGWRARSGGAEAVALKGDECQSTGERCR